MGRQLRLPTPFHTLTVTLERSPGATESSPARPAAPARRLPRAVRRSGCRGPRVSNRHARPGARLAPVRLGGQPRRARSEGDAGAFRTAFASTSKRGRSGPGSERLTFRTPWRYSPVGTGMDYYGDHLCAGRPGPARGFVCGRITSEIRNLVDELERLPEPVPRRLAQRLPPCRRRPSEPGVHPEPRPAGRGRDAAARDARRAGRPQRHPPLSPIPGQRLTAYPLGCTASRKASSSPRQKTKRSSAPGLRQSAASPPRRWRSASAR